MINIDQDNLKNGVLGLVLAVVEILRDALQNQATRRIESGSLTDEEVERLGAGLSDLDAAIEGIKREQGLEQAVQSVRDGLDDLIDDVVQGAIGSGECRPQPVEADKPQPVGAPMTADLANATAAKEEALYVYCVVRGDGGRVLGPIGLGGQVVYTVTSGPIIAVVHNCPAHPYQSPDAQVLQGWVVAHQNVVLAATEAFGTVLPMAFDMIVRGAPNGEGPGGGAAAALRDWLDERRDRFTRLLDRLAGKAEYGVQVLWDRRAIAAWLVDCDDELRKLQDEAQGKPKGMAHLLGQRLAAAIRAAMEKQADLFAQDFYARIRQCAADVRVDKLKKADGDRQMLLNLSCLTPQGGGDLGRVLDEIQRTKGIAVRFTGPWPPYSFVGG